jgi:hypothetical protein
MHNTLLFIFSAIFIVPFSSCEKVINADLKNTEPCLVIGGNVDNTSSLAKVIIRKSMDFSSTNSYPPVSGTIVTISDNLGNTCLLTESSAGTYTNTSLIGLIGRTYTPTVLLDEKVYTANSTMPRKSTSDSLIVDVDSFSGSAR